MPACNEIYREANVSLLSIYPLLKMFVEDIRYTASQLSTRSLLHFPQDEA